MENLASSRRFQWLSNIESFLSWLIIGVLLFQILLVATFSFHFRYIDDSGFLYYLTWLINEKGYLPYVDVHETSFPGTFLFYSLITRIAGYSVTGFNVMHIALLSLLSIASYGFLQRINRRMALAATLMFVSSYLMMYNSAYMQRDFVALFFIVIACNIATGHWRLPLRSCLTGLCFGLAASIKPQMALGAPFVVLCGAYLYTQTKEPHSSCAPLWKNCLAAALYSFSFFLLVALAFSGWLLAKGNWHHFLRMLTDYMPLYEELNGVSKPLTAQELWETRTDWLQNHFLSGAIPVFAGAIAIYCNKNLNISQKALAYLLFICWTMYSVSVALAGKFYDYHQIPLRYFFSGVIAICFIPTIISSKAVAAWRIVYLLLIGVWVQMTINPNYAWAMTCHDNNLVCMEPERASYNTEDRLTVFLQKNLAPHERVEPLKIAVMGPVFPALLRAGVEPVTPYLEGFEFYHHADNPYIQEIRADAIQRLKQAPPRFFIADPINFFPIIGDKKNDFHELAEFINQHYHTLDKSAYPILHDPMPVTIYELNK